MPENTGHLRDLTLLAFVRSANSARARTHLVAMLKNSKVKIVDGQPTGYFPSQALEREVVFGSLYTQEGMSGALRPPYDCDQLADAIEQNNTLEPCLSAMVTNVDGTGFEIVIDENVPDRALSESQKLTAFFSQPWPKTSFLSIRKQLRRDNEATGNAYLEGEIALVRRIDPYITRIMRMGFDSYLEEIFSPTLGVMVKVAINRRRYVQYLFGKLVYFKEFGAPMQLDRLTGKWSDVPEGSGFQADRIATEIIHFTANKHWELPYGIPRWIPQIPSVIGSRQAEEFNLGFFNAGGIPPMLIVIQGGEAADGVEQAVKNLFYSAGPHKNIAAVLQVTGTSGSLDEPGSVRVTIERFGSERQKDSMVQRYDEMCEQKIRRSWRLPPLFVGNAEGHNFACYDAETETLTDHGWIRFDQWRPGMKVACYDSETKRVAYDVPRGDKPLVYDVTDLPMYHFKNNVVDLCVTPNHRMHYATSNGVWHTRPVEQMLGHVGRPRFVSRMAPVDGGTPLESFQVPYVPLRAGSNLAYDFEPRPVAGDDFLTLLGWFISEGSLHPQMDQLTIAQKKTRHWDKVVAAVDAMERCGFPLHWHAQHPGKPEQGYVSVKSKGLALWLAENVGYYQHERRLPALFRDLPECQARLLFESLMLGDGTRDPRAGRTSGEYSSTSKGLADDVQELALRLGYRTSIGHAPPGTLGIRAIYRVRFSTKGKARGDGTMVQVDTKRDLTRPLYTGKVYCFSVPTGIFITRRNEKVAAQGNTALLPLDHQTAPFRPAGSAR